MAKDGLIGDLVGLRFRDVDWRGGRATSCDLCLQIPVEVLELRTRKHHSVKMEDRGRVFERGRWKKSIAVFTVRVG